MRKLIAFFALLIATTVSAATQDSLNAVTMIAYEQGASDFEGTLSLKNNTETPIHDLSFQITYLDMNGNELDYEDFNIKEDIAPGMTKKIDIPAYENQRGYSYYKSEAHPFHPHRFKVRFALKGYNSHETAPNSLASDDIGVDFSSNDTDFFSTPMLVIGLLSLLAILGIYVGFYVLVAVMAQRRRRNAALWVLVSLFATPLLAVIILLCIGKSDRYEDEDFGSRRRNRNESGIR